MSDAGSILSHSIPIVMVVCGATIAVTAIIAIQWRKARTAAYEARLKQIMIERGMSASEIEMVLRANALDNED